MEQAAGGVGRAPGAGGIVRTIKSEDAPGGTERSPDRRAQARQLFARRHLMGGVVLLVVSAISVGTSLAMRDVVHNQEQRLLRERAIEAADFLKASLAQTSSTLLTVGEAVAAEGASSPLFAPLAGSLTASGSTVAVAQRNGAGFSVVAASGKAFSVGAAATDGEARLIARATAADGLVYTFTPLARGNRLLSALNVPHAPKPTVVLMEQVLPKAVPSTPNADSPYRELNSVIYAGTRADPKTIVLIQDSVPTKSTVSRLVPVGADSVLLVISAHASLVGATAQAVPWIVLAGGLLLAILLTVLVEVLTRRRAYALNLVEQRTRAMYQAQMAAEAANRSKSEFLSRMSHELRTPLNAVLGFSQLLELDELSADQEQAVGQITKGGRHLLDLINEILDISQIETGKLALSPEAVAISDLVSETVDLVRPLADDRGVHMLNGDHHACAVHVFADRQRLKQILLNLLGNGIKYNREGGTVSISCARPEPGRLRIQVTDTGPGIPEQQYGLLFTPFERLGAEQTTVEGTGIGLALSRRLAEVMGGTLGVESTVGRGSTFWVDLPIVESPVERIERLDELGGTSVVDSAHEARPCVLHIEDNLSNIKLIERVLAQRPGINLIPAMQGRLGLELARQHRPILILLDLNLADVSGEEVLGALRDDPATASIPVAIVSADAMPRQVQRLLAGGASAYLTKPIDVRELLELVDKSLEMFRRRVEPLVAGQPDAGGG